VAGVLDADEWTEEELERATERTPRLDASFLYRVFFCYPEELWAALPDSLRSRVDNDFDLFANRINSVVNDWVAHGAMWRFCADLLHNRLPEG